MEVCFICTTVIKQASLSETRVINEKIEWRQGIDISLCLERFLLVHGRGKQIGSTLQKQLNFIKCCEKSVNRPVQYYRGRYT